MRGRFVGVGDLDDPLTCGSIYFVQTARADDIRHYRITLSEAKQPLSLGFANPAPLQGSRGGVILCALYTVGISSNI